MIQSIPSSPAFPKPAPRRALGRLGGNGARSDWKGRSGSLDKRVIWSVVEVGGGSINSSGTYTPPNLAGTYTVKATSVADGTASGTALVTVPFQISVDPKASSIRPSATLKLKATVTGTPNPGVTWTVTEPSGGTVAADGTYTAPSTLGLYHVVATSVADPTKKATALITVQATVPVSVSVAPYATQLNKGGTTTFVATVNGATNTAVTWTATTGTITAGGLYTAPNVFGTYTVKATSVADPSAYAVATVVVAAQAGQDKIFTYDLNGNMTSDGARTFEWDDENRLVAVNILVTGHRSEFKYDGLGRRVGIVEKDKDAQGILVLNSDKKYLWDGVGIAEEREASGGTVQKRFHGQGFQDSDGLSLFYMRDHLGSIRELTDSTQAVRARYDYDPYGRMIKISGDRDSVFGFTGHFWHGASELNLTLFRAYDPNLGRWISRDPIQENAGINRYSYVQNNPIKYFDLYGLDKTCWINTGWLFSRSIFDGPTNGNWGGKNWSGGRYPGWNGDGSSPSTDSADECYKEHDRDYGRCENNCDNGGKRQCIKDADKKLVDCLLKLPNDPRLWPRPPKAGTEGDSANFRNMAITFFGGGLGMMVSTTAMTCFRFY